MATNEPSAVGIYDDLDKAQNPQRREEAVSLLSHEAANAERNPA
jgi:hypothetical protein